MSGVNKPQLEKVDRAVLVKSMIKLDFYKEAPLAATPLLVDQLQAYFAKNVPRNELVTCAPSEGGCGADSSTAFDFCPYCGVGDTPTATTPAPKTETRVSERKVPAASESAASPKKEATMTTTEESAEGSTKKGAKKGAKKSASANGAATNGTKKGAKKGATTALATREPKEQRAIVVTPAPALDAAVSKVQELKQTTATSMWHLGRFIKTEIFDKHLHKQRVIDGKAAYQKGGFDAFCRAELGMSHTHAYKLMDVASAFSETQVKTFGTSKLGLVLQAPKEEQSKLLDAAGKKSHRELAKDVKAAKKKSGKTGKRETGRKKTPEKKVHTSKQITVASIVGRKRVALVCKTDDKRKAKKIADLPVGSIELANNVTQHFAVQASASGELVLIIETVRGE